MLKERVAGVINAEMEGIRERYAEILSRDEGSGGGVLTSVVEMGGEKARRSAEGTMEVVRGAVELGV